MELTQIQKQALQAIYKNTLDAYALNWREGYDAVIKEYLKYKNRRVYYHVDYSPYNDSCDGYEYLKALTDDEVADIKATIKALDPEGEFEFDDLVWEVPEALEDKEYLWATGRFDEELYVTKIDLETKYYCYEFKVAEFCDGVANAPSISNMRICLTDEEYAYLTAECMNYKCSKYSGAFTLCRLRTANRELYDKICNRIETSLFESNIYPCEVPIYAVEFTEIEVDAQLLAETIKGTSRK